MSNWFAAGTAAVTTGSATVTGTGTAWIAGAQVGEEFRLLGATRGYEITAVVSDTQITITPAYMDSTQTGQSYSIVPVRGFLQRTYDAMAGAMAQWTTFLDGPLAGRFDDGATGDTGIGFKNAPGTGFWRNGSGDVVGERNGSAVLKLVSGGVETPKLTGDAVQSNATDAASGRLMAVGAFGLGGSVIEYTGDIDDQDMETGSYVVNTAAIGTKPGSQTFGLMTVMRRGSPTTLVTQIWQYSGQMYVREYISAAWTGWTKIFTQATLLGTVSESSGTPTGAVIERGSNANGEYVRFADGTQICTHTVTLAYASANIVSKTWTFPAAFIANAVPAAILSNQAGDYTNVALRDLGVLVAHPTSLTSAVSNQYRVAGAGGTWDGTSDAANVRVSAIGRWF